MREQLTEDEQHVADDREVDGVEESNGRDEGRKARRRNRQRGIELQEAG